MNHGYLYFLFYRTAFKKIPVVEGKEIDLYLLYWLVTAQGGWEKVSFKKNLVKSRVRQHRILLSCALVRPPFDAKLRK